MNVGLRDEYLSSRDNSLLTDYFKGQCLMFFQMEDISNRFIFMLVLIRKRYHKKKPANFAGFFMRLIFLSLQRNPISFTCSHPPATDITCKIRGEEN
jgi:hypothetical protein